MNKCLQIAMLASFSALWLAEGLSAAPNYTKKDTWRETMVANLGAGPSQTVSRTLKDFAEDRQALEIVADWILQDELGGDVLQTEAIGRVLNDLGPAAGNLSSEFDSLVGSNAPPNDPRWAELYLAACETRRDARLTPHRDKLRRIVFTKHYDMGGSHYAYTEGQSDAQAERHFQAGTGLFVLEMGGPYGNVRTLIDAP